MPNNNPKVNPETGRIEGGYYNGLTPSEADELYQGLHKDYRDKVRQQQSDYVTGKTRDAINTAGRVIQDVADFTPLGAVNSLVKGIEADYKGETGEAFKNYGYVGLELLPLIGKPLVKGLKSLKPLVTNKLYNKLETPSFKLSKDLDNMVTNFRKELSEIYDNPEFQRRVRNIAGYSKKEKILNRAEAISKGELVPVSQAYRTPNTGNVMGYYKHPELNKYTQLTGKPLSEYEQLSTKIPQFKRFVDPSKLEEIDHFANPELGSSFVTINKKLFPKVPRNLEEVKNIFRKTPKKVGGDLRDLSDKSLLVHELEGHGLTMGDHLLPTEFKRFSNTISDDAIRLAKNSEIDKGMVSYLFKPTEVRARMSQMRNLRKELLGKDWYDEFTLEDYNKIANSGKDISPMFFTLIERTGKTPEFIDMLNKMYVPAAATAVGTKAAIGKKRLGGILLHQNGNKLSPSEQIKLVSEDFKFRFPNINKSAGFIAGKTEEDEHTFIPPDKANLHAMQSGIWMADKADSANYNPVWERFEQFLGSPAYKGAENLSDVELNNLKKFERAFDALNNLRTTTFKERIEEEGGEKVDYGNINKNQQLFFDNLKNLKDEEIANVLSTDFSDLKNSNIFKKIQKALSLKPDNVSVVDALKINSFFTSDEGKLKYPDVYVESFDAQNTASKRLGGILYKKGGKFNSTKLLKRKV